MKTRKNALSIFRSRIPRAIGVGGALMFAFWVTSGFKASDVWVVPLTLIGLAVLLLPAIFVQIYDVRIKHPKPVFVEPSPVTITVALGVWAVIAFMFMIFISDVFHISDEYIGWELLAWAAITLGVPINTYMIYIFTRYKRVVEYGTAEWERRHRQR